MAAAFDFHTMSLTLDSTLEEWRQAYADDISRRQWGALSPWDVVEGDRSKVLSFRHEHAHFMSFAASGLADLYGVVSDYVYVLTYSVIHRKLMADDFLAVPVLSESPGPAGEDPADGAARAAWDQVNRLRACLFGFGMRGPLTQVTDAGPHDAFWALHADTAEDFRPIIERYRRLLDALADTRDVPDPGPALPLVQLSGGRQRRLSARAVMEAYAVAVELSATHLRFTWSSGNYYSRPTQRRPGPLYTAALEYALEAVGSPGAGLGTFLSGGDTTDYVLMTTLTFAAMQVPVQQELDGEVSIGGTLATLSVAHRFQAVVEGIREGRIPLPPAETWGSREENRAMREWLTACHRALGDAHSMNMYKAARAAFEEDGPLRSMTGRSQSLIQLSWAARANFQDQPSQWVCDAGLWAERFLCPPRFLRTADGKVIHLMEAAEFEHRWIGEHAGTILEAAVFGDQWESTWEKLPELGDDSRVDSVFSAVVHTQLLFQFFDAEHLPPLIPVVRADWPTGPVELNRLGLAMQREGRYGDALHAHYRVVQLFQAAGEYYAEAVALTAFARALGKAGRMSDEAAGALERAIRIFEGVGDVHREGRARRQLALIRDAQGRRDEAVGQFRRAAALARRVRDVRLWVGATAYLARARVPARFRRSGTGRARRTTEAGP
ncbi:tetratricopeptide repeat protein [Streptomyces sp. NPDC001315]|uniref:tetratricopeptide repeat protein n=1 Tax=Streptomyces sp. NPDC001315 TaxID=3364562 RepID=UPI00369D8C4C